MQTSSENNKVRGTSAGFHEKFSGKSRQPACLSPASKEKNAAALHSLRFRSMLGIVVRTAARFIVAIDTSSGNLMLPGKHCLSQARAATQTATWKPLKMLAKIGTLLARIGSFPAVSKPIFAIQSYYTFCNIIVI